MKICIGIDVHSEKLTAKAVPFDEGDEDEIEFCEDFNREFRTVKAEGNGLFEMAGWLEDVDHSILIESGTKTHVVYWNLVDSGCTVVVANANDLFRITKSVKKTDFHDCDELAHYMRRYLLGEKEFSVCLIVDRKWMDRRQMCRIYTSKSKDFASLKRRIRSYMLVRGISSIGWNRDIASKDSLDRLERLKIAPISILAADARNSSQTMKLVYGEIQREFEGDPYYSILRSIPGFGVVSSSYLSSLIIDIGRFGTQSEFAAYFGIVPKQRDSGSHVSRCGITHRGDDTGRELLVMATIAHIRTDRGRTSKISLMYDRMRARGVPNKKAYVACANRMTRIIFAMLREGREYHQER